MTMMMIYKLSPFFHIFHIAKNNTNLMNKICKIFGPRSFFDVNVACSMAKWWWNTFWFMYGVITFMYRYLSTDVRTRFNLLHFQPIVLNHDCPHLCAIDDYQWWVELKFFINYFSDLACCWPCHFPCWTIIDDKRWCGQTNEHNARHISFDVMMMTTFSQWFSHCHNSIFLSIGDFYLNENADNK